MQRLLAVLLLLTGFGCTPALHNTPPADDDDATADDDDATADDDDATMGCDDAGDGSVGLWSSEGADFAGTWYDGELSISGDTITVTDATGTQASFSTSTSDWIQGLDGPGRVFWFNGGNTAWGTDAVLAVESFAANWVRLAISNATTPPWALTNEWGFDVQPDLDGCGELVRGECGDYLPLPLMVTLPDTNGGLIEAVVLPGEILQFNESVGFQHLGGHVFEEVICPDVPAVEYGWIFGQLIEGVVIGVQ